ncbi:hypothetical protein LVD15_18700 [Fulvivirga maritima]|uniref:hypothetical protein n=1 Tax=Fulvivirga maritima TaxID=2904247 RepID=UPI001F42C95A|nr:hypothetical protein [Fulvivirga maritima]UII25320.1 hypothetical protein LVD15_18700 [Fulvivirga maritima]
MKKQLLYIIPIAILLASCEVVVVEEPVISNARDQFLGYYEVDEYSTTFDEYVYYNMDVVRGEYRDEVFLTNFYGANIDVLAEVNGNSIYIPSQRVDGYYIQGNGRINGNQLVINFNVDDYYDHHVPTNYCELVAYR